MIKSMTAFGRAVREGEDKDITVEIRSVNSRYLDCSVRAPRAYACLEDKIKTLIQSKVTSRGKVEVSLTVTPHGNPVTALTLDEDFLKAYLAALGRLRDEYGLADDISVMKVAARADVFTMTRKEEDVTEDMALIEEVLLAAAADFSAMREAEGKRLEADFREKLATIRAYVEQIGAHSTEEIAAYREKLEARLRALLDNENLHPDENRILTECALMADRLAVDEELVRLNSHFEAFEKILCGKEPAGRKLDFLMQEMNRETNTIGSKCCSAAIAQIVVNIKSELEKIREQVQNIE